MVFKIEFDRGRAIEWHATPDGARSVLNDSYTPSLFVAGTERRLADLETALSSDPKVCGLEFESYYTSLHDEVRSDVLRVDVERTTEISTLAREIRFTHEMNAPPGTYRLFNVDFSPQFRYCLDEGIRPVPERTLSTCSIRIDDKQLADGNLSSLSIDGDSVSASASELQVLETLSDRLADADPDVLILSDDRLVPLLFEKADSFDFDSFALGRRPGFTRLAGANTFESYGRVGHSPARFDVPGRVLIDESHSFLWSETNLDGLFDLVSHSRKPLQELAWASIGNVLTAIQICVALERDVLVPWNKWEPEGFKDLRTLHNADRGGFTFAPAVGLHENVVEVDFSSLYPRIMVTRNISPDTICCSCHSDREDVPELGYSVCDRRGFLVDVLEPVLAHRFQLKDRIRTTNDPDERTRLEQRSSAFKWILVSCFGYQGYRNSKFGRIECHEAINAVAREIILTAKDICEEAGWEVVHGIVDSLWITPRKSNPCPVSFITENVSSTVGIPLDFEAEYEWVAFVPKRSSNAGSLMTYFGKVSGQDTFKLRGVEARQRSTCPFVASVQLELIEVLDQHRRPEPVCDRLRHHLETLRSGNVSPDDLLIRTRVSKSAEEYAQRNYTLAALQRAKRFDVSIPPGRDVRYVVVDDDARHADRIRLHFEEIHTYDPTHYESCVLRAVETILSPLGWGRRRMVQYLNERADTTLSHFVTR